MVLIESVIEGSPAQQAGLAAGDFLLRINDRPQRDLVDYHLSQQEAHLLIDVLRNDEVLLFDCIKDEDEDFGLEVEHPQPLQCGNQCVFCFVHQLPKGLRRSLYIKDEDYRFSWLYGSFVTLTNLTEEDFQRIKEDHLSPLYISVHATDQSVRDRLLDCPAAPIMPALHRLVAAGIDLHCQIVLCPGFNDGRILEQTITDLAALFPRVCSIAVVPVGLTRHRGRLPHIAAVTFDDAQQCLHQLEKLQKHFQTSRGQRLVYAADEIYLLAGKDFPPTEDYDDFPQLENGVGLIPWFRTQAEEVLAEAEPLDLQGAVVVTGQSFCPEMKVFSEQLTLRTGVEIEVAAIENHLFGTSVTVAGLVAGRDLLEQLQPMVSGRGVIIPDVMLESTQRLFLDDLDIDHLREQLQVPVVVVEASAWGVLDGLEQLADNPVDVVRCR